VDSARALVPFVETIRCGSFAKAAIKLGVTPAAVSKSVMVLERRLGVRLINRTTRSLHLTVEGERLYARLATLLDGIDEAINDVQYAADKPTGVIRISVGATFGRYALLPALVVFMQRYPQVQLEVSFDDAPSSLIDDGFEIGIHHGFGRETSYASRVLCDYPLFLVASPDYLQRRGTPRVPKDLAGHDCIGIRTGTGLPANWVLESIDRRAGRRTRAESMHVHKPKPRLLIARQWDTDITAALLGAGIAPTSLPAALQFLKQGRLKIVLPDFRIRPMRGGGLGKIFILYPHRKLLPGKLRVLIDFLVDWFTDHKVEISDLSTYSA
jgi:LysR family transcriptional regulator, transcriptional activator for dmlA